MKPPERPNADTLLADMRAVAERGDWVAFNRLFTFYGERVKAYLRHSGVDDAAAEDLTQDVFSVVWRRAGQFDPRQGALATWIFTIARNRRIDVLRRERRPAPDPTDPVLAPEAPIQGDAAVEAEEMKERIKSAVADLPPEQADLLRAFYFDDKTHVGIADEFGLPLGTVKSRLRLALAKLRVILGRER